MKKCSILKVLSGFTILIVFYYGLNSCQQVKGAIYKAKSVASLNNFERIKILNLKVNDNDEVDNNLLLFNYTQEILQLLKSMEYNQLYTVYSNNENSILTINTLHDKFNLTGQIKSLVHNDKDYDAGLYFYNIKSCNLNLPPIIGIGIGVLDSLHVDYIPAYKFVNYQNYEEILLSEETAINCKQPILIMLPTNEKDIQVQKKIYLGEINSILLLDEDKSLKSNALQIKDIIPKSKLLVENGGNTNQFQFSLDAWKVNYAYESDGELEYKVAWFIIDNVYPCIYSCNTGELEKDFGDWLVGTDIDPTYANENRLGNTYYQYCACDDNNYKITLMDAGNDYVEYAGITWEWDWFATKKDVDIVSEYYGTIECNIRMTFDDEWYQKFSIIKDDFEQWYSTQTINSKGYIKFRRWD